MSAAEKLPEVGTEIETLIDRLEQIDGEWREAVAAGDDDKARRLESESEQGHAALRRLEARAEALEDAVAEEQTAAQLEQGRQYAAEADRVRGEISKALGEAEKLASKLEAVERDLPGPHAWTIQANKAVKHGVPVDELERQQLPSDFRGRLAEVGRKLSGLADEANKTATLGR